MRRVLYAFMAAFLAIFITGLWLCPPGGMNESNIGVYQWWYEPLVGISFVAMLVCAGLLIRDDINRKL